MTDNYNVIEVYKVAIETGKFDVIHFREQMNSGVKLNLAAFSLNIFILTTIYKYPSLPSLLYIISGLISVLTIIYINLWYKSLVSTLRWSQSWYSVAGDIESKNPNIFSPNTGTFLITRPENFSGATKGQTKDYPAQTAKFAAKAFMILHCILLIFIFMIFWPECWKVG